MTHALAEPLLVEPDWIAEHLDDRTVRVVEVDVNRTAYEQGHVPGAVLWNAYTDLRHADYSPVDTAELGQLLSRSGVTAETTVVVYGYAAHLGFWLLESFGHEHVRLLDGPREQWPTAGYGWNVEVPVPAASPYTPAVAGSRLGWSRDAVEALVGASDHVILDVRSQAEYDGDRFWPSGAPEETGRAGHVPGSVHVPIELLRSEDGRFKEPDELRRILGEHGITPDRRIVTYCTIGNRAGQAWFAMSHLLDYPDVDVYYGSWAEWGMRADTTVARGTST